MAQGRGHRAELRIHGPPISECAFWLRSEGLRSALFPAFCVAFPLRSRTHCVPKTPKDLSGFGETCSFQYDRARFGFSPRRRGAMLHQAGNSFNPAVVGVASLWVLLQMLPSQDDQSQAVSSIQPVVATVVVEARRRRLERFHSDLSTASNRSVATED